MALKGAVMGFSVGQLIHLVSPQREFEIQKLHASISGGPFSFKSIRYMRQVMGPFMLMGALSFLGYEVMGDLTTNHGHSYGRPRFYEDFWKFGIIFAALSVSKFGLRYLFHGAVIGGVIFNPVFQLTRTIAIEQRTTTPLEIHYMPGTTEA